jgi:hypothetical protein
VQIRLWKKPKEHDKRVCCQGYQSVASSQLVSFAKHSVKDLSSIVCLLTAISSSNSILSGLGSYLKQSNYVTMSLLTTVYCNKVTHTLKLHAELSNLSSHGSSALFITAAHALSRFIKLTPVKKGGSSCFQISQRIYIIMIVFSLRSRSILVCAEHIEQVSSAIDVTQDDR